MTQPSKKNDKNRRNRRLAARGVRRSSPDLHRLSRAVIQLAIQQAADEAAAEAEERERRRSHPDA
jgi:hypothetical protein